MNEAPIASARFMATTWFPEMTNPRQRGSSQIYPGRGTVSIFFAFETANFEDDLTRSVPFLMDELTVAKYADQSYDSWILPFVGRRQVMVFEDGEEQELDATSNAGKIVRRFAANGEVSSRDSKAFHERHSPNNESAVPFLGSNPLFAANSWEKFASLDRHELELIKQSDKELEYWVTYRLSPDASATITVHVTAVGGTKVNGAWVPEQVRIIRSSSMQSEAQQQIIDIELLEVL